MAHIKNRLRGLLVAFVALVAALAIVPGVAQAEPGDAWTGTETGSVIITGANVSTANTFHVYKVADITLDTDTNVTDLVPVTGLESQVNTWKDSATATTAQAIADAVKTSSVAEVQGVSASAHEGGVELAPLTAGVYLIQIDNVVEGDNVRSYQNIVVALEPTPEDDGTWTINSETVPVKSTDSTLTKTVTGNTGEDVFYAPGDVVTFTVTFATSTNMATFELSDTMTGATLNADSITLHVGDEEHTAGQYFTVTGNTGDSTFTIKLTADGIALTAADDAPYFTYTGTVTGDATLEDGVSNKVVSTEGGQASTELQFGGLAIYKYGDDPDTEEVEGVDNPLQGAVFGIYTDPTCSDESLVLEIITGADGWAKTDEAHKLDLTKTYYVQEISAPAGYQRVDTIFTFVPSGASGGNVFNLVAGEYTEATVKNTPSTREEGIDLPQTGGMGTVALTAAGVVLVAGAAAFIVRSRKEN